MTTPLLNNVFRDSIEHVYAEMRLVNLYIKKLVMAARTRDALWERKDLRGLYISDKEVAYLLGIELYPWSADLFEISADSTALAGEITLLQTEIARKKAASISSAITLRLEDLVNTFSLNEFEKMALLLSLLPEIAPHSERLFGYIQDDVTRKRPTVALALDAFCSSNIEKLDGREAFLPGSRLVSNRLLHLYDDNSRKNSPLTSLSLKVDNRITGYLMGSDAPDAQLLPWVKVHQPDREKENGSLPDNLDGYLMRAGEESVLIFSGTTGINEQELAALACRRLQTPLLAADFSRMLELEADPTSAVMLLCREAKLMGAAVFARHFDAVTASKHAAGIFTELENFRGKIMACGDNWNTLALHWGKRIPVPYNFPMPGYEEREVIWQKHSLPGNSIPAGIINTVTGKFQLDGNQIAKAVRLARGLGWQDDSTCISQENLLQACRMISSTRLMEVAQKINPRYRLNDIVLPPEPAGQLQEILDYVNYRHVVLDKWCFRQKSSLGKGLNILFSGPSGTGKTMAAEIISGELGLDLYKVDLSIVVSKYIGETEKNLDRVFKEARDSNCVLFFDEADALFGKRSEVKDAHDRYANIEIAYLLQKMEEYEGIVILATNLKKNVDEAFSRRMHFSIEFPTPEQEYRLLIWQKSFPVEAPVAPGLDFDFMSRQFRLTGGNIKNIALTAAFLAAKEGGAINMNNLVLATRREYQKTGKLSTEAEFGKYYSLVNKQ